MRPAEHRRRSSSTSTSTSPRQRSWPADRLHRRRNRPTNNAKKLIMMATRMMTDPQAKGKPSRRHRRRHPAHHARVVSSAVAASITFGMVSALTVLRVQAVPSSSIEGIQTLRARPAVVAGPALLSVGSTPTDAIATPQVRIVRRIHIIPASVGTSSTSGRTAAPTAAFANPATPIARAAIRGPVRKVRRSVLQRQPAAPVQRRVRTKAS